jgi:hypothetical protein
VPAPAAIGEAGPCGAPSTPEEAQEEVAAGPAAGYGMFPAASSPPQPLECKLRRRSKKEGPPPAPDAQVVARLRPPAPPVVAVRPPPPRRRLEKIIPSAVLLATGARAPAQFVDGGRRRLPHLCHR